MNFSFFGEPGRAGPTSVSASNLATPKSVQKIKRYIAIIRATSLERCKNQMEGGRFFFVEWGLRRRLEEGQEPSKTSPTFTTKKLKNKNVARIIAKYQLKDLTNNHSSEIWIIRVMKKGFLKLLLRPPHLMLSCYGCYAASVCIHG